MPAAAAELQRAVLNALTADAAVAALIGDRVYDRMPGAGEYPCVTFGPAEAVTEDVECIAIEEHVLQLDCWSQDQGLLHPCKTLVAVVKAALHEVSLALPDPLALAALRVTATRCFRDRDEITAHGVVTLTARIET